jgi:hypothetical protein
MQDVTNYYNFPARYLAQFFPDGIGIKKCLGGMFVRAVSGIYDGGIHIPGQKYTGSGIGVPHNHHIDFHGKDIVNGINKRLPLLNGRLPGGKINDIGRKPFFGKFERQPRPGTVFEKYIGYGDIPEGGYFFNGAVDNLLKMVGSFKNELNILFIQIFDPEQVTYT